MTTISDPSAMTPDDPRWLSWFMQQRRFDRLSRKAQTGASLITDFAAGIYEMGYPGQRRGNYELSDLVKYARSTGGGRFNSSGVYERVGNDVPRLDYDPVTLQPLGLLIEEQRTNLATHSEEFDNATWTKSGTSVSANSATGPGGVGTADRLIEDNGLGAHRVMRAISATQGVMYTMSVYIKAAGRNFAQLRYENNGSTKLFALNVNLTNGSSSPLNVGGVTGTGYKVEKVGNGWYRVSIAFSSDNTAASLIVYASDALGSNSYTGDGTSGVYIWGAQLEAGAFPTSYIPTVASQVTRAADVCSVNTLSPWYNASKGTFEVSARGIVGQPLLTAGGAVIIADSATFKDYSLSYTTDPSASSLVIGKGHTRSIKYFPRSDA